jgi:hypothetical protein
MAAGGRHPTPGRHQSEWPADIRSERVADITSESVADFVGMRSHQEDVVRLPAEAE